MAVLHRPSPRKPLTPIHAGQAVGSAARRRGFAQASGVGILAAVGIVCVVEEDPVCILRGRQAIGVTALVNSP